MLSTLKNSLLGDLPAFTGNPLEYVEYHSAGREKPLSLRFGPKKVMFVFRPSAIHHVLVSAASQYGKGNYQNRLRPLLGEGMITASGPRHEAARTAVRSQFGGSGLDTGMAMAMTVLMQEVAGLARHSGNDALSLPPFAGRLTLRMATAAMFHGALSEKAASEVYRLAADAHHWVSETMWKPVYLGTTLPTPSNRRFRQLVRALETVVEELRQEPKGVLASLLSLEKDYGAQAVRDEFNTLLLAGFETSATTASWMLYALASRPGAVAWLREEIDAVLSGGQDLTPETLRRMKRTQAVVDETMRLYPPTWWFAREALADDVIDGEPVSKGTAVFICPWLLHRQPDLWENAGEFMPERFLTPLADRHAFIPFGAGERACIGQHLARAEFAALAATMVSAFDLEPLSGSLEQLRPVGGITLAPPPDGLNIRLHLRSRQTVRKVA